MIAVRFERFPSIFARIEGKSGCIREYDCLIDPISDFCIVPKVDAYALGYPEVAFQHMTVGPPNSRTLLTSSGYNRTVVFTINGVKIGQLRFEDVQFVAFDLPQASGYEAVIGRSLLERTSVAVDWPEKTIKMVKQK